jgi:hypothetical protein
MTTDTKPAVFVAITDATTPHGDFHQGQTFRADHPLVVAYGDKFFAPEGTPISEFITPFDTAVATNDKLQAEANERRQAAALAKAAANVVTLDVTDVYRLQRDLVLTDEGRTVRKGSTVLGSDPLVAAHPDAFKVVPK